MHSTYYEASPTSVRFHLSPDFVAVVLFCLTGIALSVAILSSVPADEFAAILAY